MAFKLPVFTQLDLESMKSVFENAHNKLRERSQITFSDWTALLPIFAASLEAALPEISDSVSIILEDEEEGRTLSVGYLNAELWEKIESREITSIDPFVILVDKFAVSYRGSLDASEEKDYLTPGPAFVTFQQANGGHVDRWARKTEKVLKDKYNITIAIWQFIPTIVIACVESMMEQEEVATIDITRTTENKIEISVVTEAMLQDIMDGMKELQVVPSVMMLDQLTDSFDGSFTQEGGQV